jgi:hypothetical protein
MEVTQWHTDQAAQSVASLERRAAPAIARKNDRCKTVSELNGQSHAVPGAGELAGRTAKTVEAF